MRHQYKIENMKCAGCVSAVKSALEGIPGIESAEVDLETALATLEGEADDAMILKTLEEAGYPGSPAE